MAALLAASLAPVLALALWLYHQDRRSPEPSRALLGAFAWGAFSVVPALLIESQLAPLVPLLAPSRAAADALLAFGVAGAVQEGVKLWAVRRALAATAKVDEALDCAVYAGFVALGFAAVENVAYVLRGGWEAAALRALLSVPAHALLGVLMGWFLSLGAAGAARAFFVPALLHGTFDYIALRGGALAGSDAAMWALAALLWFAAIRALRSLRRRQPLRR